MDIHIEFQEAKQAIDELTQRPSNEELLRLYGLYKQANFGNNNDEEPQGFDIKAIAKHRAWLDQSGKSAKDAMEEYVSVAHSLVEKYSG